jgi:hypothetical protein
VRFGNRPKRLIPFTTDMPFPKILRVLKDVNGEKHRIEALCDGQQFLVDGLNPDANINYAWHAGRSLANTNLAELPVTTAEDMEKLVDHLVDMLVEKFGFEDVTGEGDGPRTEWREDGEKFDPEAALAAMLPDPASVENVQRRVALSWMRAGMHPDEILERLVSRTMEVAKSGGLNWDHNKEVSEVARRIIDRFRFLARDYKTELPPWLPGEFHVDYMDVVSQGLTPILSRNRYGFFIRKAGRDANGSAKNGNGHAAEGFGQEQREAPKSEPLKTERKLQFRLIRYKDMRPGVDPTYLVDELIPSAGLVLLWGKEKTYKSFWLLDVARRRRAAVRHAHIVEALFWRLVPNQLEDFHVTGNRSQSHAGLCGARNRRARCREGRQGRLHVQERHCQGCRHP